MNPIDLQQDLDSMGLLVRALEAWAARNPDKAFIYYGEENRILTYGDFNRRANNLAGHLRDLGVEKGDRVSLFLHHPLTTILSMFGIWKIGAVFCPINFLYQGRLLSYQINDVQPKLLISEQSRIPVLNQIRGDLPVLPVWLHVPEIGDHDYREAEAAGRLETEGSVQRLEELLEENRTNPEVPLDYWDPANIIYTSGTTGPPKGVVQSHRWLQNYCYYGVRMLHPEDVVYCDLPLYHVGGAFSLVGRAAWRGCSVAVWDRFSASDFWNRVRRSGATYGLLLDVMMPWLLQAPETPEDRRHTLRRVHMQPLPDYHRRFAERFGIDWVNVGYGATEIGYACAALIEESVGEAWKPAEFRKGFSKEELRQIAAELDLLVLPGNRPLPKGFMGRACRFHEVAVVGEHNESLPAGVAGQIVLRGRLPHVLLHEYFHQPEATVEVFRHLWFHTGDGALQDDEGIFYFVDRVGGFIRVRGENISSFQIEDTINAHPGVVVSAAFPIKAAEGLEDDIVVYIVPAPGSRLSEEELRPWLDDHLPKYMRPRYLRFIEALPQTPSCKVEKYKLKARFLKEQGM